MKDKNKVLEKMKNITITLIITIFLMYSLIPFVIIYQRNVDKNKIDIYKEEVEEKKNEDNVFDIQSL